MKAHADLKKLLASKNMQAFVVDLCHYAYEWTEFIPVEGLEYKIFEEFRLREDTGEKTRKGLDKKLQLIPDALLFVKPGYRSLNQGQCFTVALEIKGEKGDLMSDDKLYKYLGWTDFLFIAVPADLADDAQNKVDQINADHPETVSKIGVVQLDTGTICRWPKRSKVTVEKQNLVLQNAVYNYAFKDAKNIIFKPEEQPTVATPSVASAPVTQEGIVCVKEEEKQLHQENLHEENYQEVDVLQSYTLQDDFQKPSVQQETSSVLQGNSQSTTYQGNIKVDVKQKGSNVNKHLSDEEKAARRAKLLARQECREKQAEVLSGKAAVLPEEARQRLSSLPFKAQEVFWTIRESEKGEKQKDLATKLGYSERTTSSCLSSLTAAGLIKRDGCRKTGSYNVSSVAACNTTCATCSIALQCKDYQPAK